jgi:hypothetical protein
MLTTPTPITPISPSNCSLNDTVTILAARAALLAVQKNATTLLGLKQTQVQLGVRRRKKIYIYIYIYIFIFCDWIVLGLVCFTRCIFSLLYIFFFFSSNYLSQIFICSESPLNAAIYAVWQLCDDVFHHRSSALISLCASVHVRLSLLCLVPGRLL